MLNSTRNTDCEVYVRTYSLTCLTYLQIFALPASIYNCTRAAYCTADSFCKVIKKIVEETGVKIDIEDDGRVMIMSNDAEASAKAVKIIEDLTAEVEVGRTYLGKVVRITDFGAFVEVLPGKDGLVHISQLALERVKKVEDVVKVGDEIMVKCVEIDKQGRVNLSRKVLLSKEDK